MLDLFTLSTYDSVSMRALSSDGARSASEGGDRMSEPRPPHVHRYTDRHGEHRWQIIGANGEIIAVSSEGYTDPRDRDRSLDLAMRALAVAADAIEET